MQSQSTDNELDGSTEASSTSTRSQPQPAPAPMSSTTGATTKNGNGALAGGAVLAGVALFAAVRLLSGAPSLAQLESQAVPLDVALNNGKPTLVEFYANWCEVCRELVPVEVGLEEQFRSEVNFVMLNIENTKWAPEMTEYQVGGIPHFVFLNDQGEAQAAAVGKVPSKVLEANLAALVKHQPLPYAGARGATSSLSGQESSPRQVQPRDHA